MFRTGEDMCPKHRGNTALRPWRGPGGRTVADTGAASPGGLQTRRTTDTVNDRHAEHTIARVVRSARSPTRKVMLGVGLFIGVCSVAVLGYMIAGWPAGDAAYMVVITIFGVGYGEVQPVASWPLRLLTTMVIVGGYGAVFFALGGVVQMIIDGEITSALGARRMSKDIDRLEGHAVICGYGRMGSFICREFDRRLCWSRLCQRSARQARAMGSFPDLEGDHRLSRFVDS